MNKILIAETTKNIKMINRLSRDKDGYIRSRVVLNPNCPIELIYKLCEDESNWVIQNILSNPNLDEEILSLLKLNEKIKEKVKFLN